MKIGAQLYTLREYLQDEKSIFESLKKVRDIGYKYVQLSGVARMDVSKLKAELDRLGLEAVCTHIPYNYIKNNIKEVAKAHHELGCGYVGLGAMPDEFRNKEGYYAFTKEFDALAASYEDEGLKLTYHNHNFEFVKFDGKTGMQIMLENSEKFLFLADTYWIQAGGGDVTSWLEKLKGRIEIVHFKDYGVVPKEGDPWALDPVFCEIGSGNLDWAKIIKECENLGVTHAFVEQDNCYGKNPFDALETSYNFLKKAAI